MTRRYSAIALLLGACAIALIYQSRRLGLTVDETSHFAASYMYWLGDDALDPADAPPLTRALCGWVPRLLHAPSPLDTNGRKDRDAYLIGAEILDRPNIRARRLLFYSRLPFLVFPLLTVFLLWHWGRQLFGEPVALCVAACGALEPTILGHGVLINSDTPAAFGALWFAYTAWKYWLTPDLRRLLVMTLATVFAVLIKFTLAPLAIAAFALAIWKGPRLWAAIVIPLALYFGILATSQFRAAIIPEAQIQQFRGAGVPDIAMGGVRLLALLPWPPQFIRGLLFIGGSLQGEGFTGYMLGHKIRGSVPLYFPLAWAIKFPMPLQLLTLAGLVALAIRIRRRKAGAADVLIWGSALFFFGAATLSNSHIGFRHVVPALPFFILGGGFAMAQWSRYRAGRAAIAVCIVWLAASSLHAYPHGIGYFNEWIGGPAQGWRYLADSNVDWGQDLPELGRYMERSRVPAIKTFIFGYDNPYHYLKPGTMDPQTLPSPDNPTLARAFEPTPGTYAVSANFLAGFLFPPGYEDYLSYFRQRPPDARAGYSILIYEVK
uniref:Glycosyltransferase RgtA/B/C/D-like domain-containing protein n=1 Tax=Solibacter usitatus (strain Ellin6076) TaxID=234267 RepID=Q02BR9_SOLUE